MKALTRLVQKVNLKIARDLCKTFPSYYQSFLTIDTGPVSSVSPFEYSSVQNRFQFMLKIGTQ